VPRQREALAALPQAPHANGAQRNGTTRATLYRELSTSARPAIGAQPADAVPGGIETNVTQQMPPHPGVTQPIVTEAVVTETVVTETITGEPLSLGPNASVPRHARQEVIEAPLTSGADGLPRRVRQTSIVPQLRNEPPPITADNPAEGANSRTPEELRAMMSSFQAGMARGRRDAEADTDFEPGTPERDSQ
jgi:hypothetical protein